MDTLPVFNAVLDEYITQAFALAMTNADDAEIDALFGSVFEEQAQYVCRSKEMGETQNGQNKIAKTDMHPKNY